MNFQTVASKNGELESMVGKLDEIGSQKLSKNNKPYCGCKITDSTGTQRSATINAGKDGCPQADLLGKNCVFALSTYQGKNGVAYSGFCNGIAHDQNQAPPQQQTPYTPAGKPFVPPQQTYTPVPQPKQRDFDKEAHGKCYSILLAALIQSGRDPASIPSDILTKTALADCATDCMNSYAFRTPISEPTQEPDQQPNHGQGYSNDDIPF